MNRYYKIILKRKFLPHIIAWFILVAATLLGAILFYSTLSDKIRASHFNKTFNRNIELVEKQDTKVVEELKTNTDIWSFVDSLNQNKPKQISYLIYSKDSLIAWTDRVPIGENENIDFNKKIIKIGNYWYYSKTTKVNKLELVSLLRFRADFAYSNEYFHNHFTLNLPFYNFDIDTNPSSKGYKVSSKGGEYLFTLKKPKLKETSNAYVITLLILLCILYSFKILFLALKYARTYRLKRNIFYISLLAGITLYILHTFYRYPFILFEIPLFSDRNFTNIFLFENFGSILIFSIITFFFCLAYNKFLDKELILKKNTCNVMNHILVYFHWLVAASLWLLFNSLFLSTFKDLSSIMLVLKLSHIGNITLIRTLILCTSLVGIILLIDSFIKKYHKYYSGKVYLAIIVLSVIPAVIFFHKSYNNISYISFLLISAHFLYINYKKRRRAYSFFIWLVLILAIATVATLFNYSNEKETIYRKGLILKLADRFTNEEEPLSETLLRERENKIANDKKIVALFSNEKVKIKDLEQYLLSTYFNDYLAKFNISVDYCSEKNKDHISAFSKYDCFHNKEEIANSSRVIGSNNFIVDQSRTNQTVYIGRFKYKINNNNVTLYIKLSSDPIQTEIEYPDFLLSYKEKDMLQEYENYSFAKYSNGVLIQKRGTYDFPLNQNSRIDKAKNFDVYKYSGYTHMIYHSKNNVSIVLSMEDITNTRLLIAFSIFFIGFFICSSILLIFIGRFRNRKVNYISVKDRIQASVIALTLSVLVVFILTSFRQTKKRIEEKNFKIITEKTKSIQREFHDSFKLFEPNNPELNTLLERRANEISNIFYTDLNIYDTQGRLLNTTRPEVFDRKLIGNIIDSEAFIRMRYNSGEEFIKYQYIGEYSYLSSYIAILNTQNEVLAYVNAPYILETNELGNEITSMLMGAVNFYIVFLIIIFAAIVIISQQITYPILALKNKLKTLKIGRSNEKLSYKWNDEIGMLVSEYNKMVDALPESVNKLAKSQREMAWREMAQQIAHEIKNPLTPMRLSIQHLERTYKDKPENFDQLLYKISATLIEQIDKLTAISSEFSKFAKMPRANLQPVDVIALVYKCTHLFEEEPNTVIKFDNNVYGTCIIYADSKQLISVFNNLIKNAIQASPQEKQAIITVSINDTEEYVTIDIKDNGKGISDDIKDKLFMPYFTTKSSGTGLGLAIVKSMVDTNSGTISFESELGVGTTFTVIFPKMKDKPE